MRRRTFLAGGSALPFLADTITGAEPASHQTETFLEPPQPLPIVRTTDVIVCGGGPAGVAAAVAAARNRARTTLLEVNGCLGGIWTAGLLSWILDSGNKRGLIHLRSLIARDVDGLLLAGRCISGDFIAHSSYRVTGNAVPTGEAAGTAAALSVAQEKLPQDIPWPEIATAIAAVSAG